jgi:hypothetical protein
MTKVWYSGLDNYRKHSLEFNETENVFTLELLDVDSRNANTVQDAFRNHLDGVNLPVEVLYSGGLDSECVIQTCLDLNIPVEAFTLRLLIRGIELNQSDVFYAKRFCSAHSVKHNIVDLDIDKFYNNGDHIPYMETYRFSRIPTATILWLIEQCSSFPIIGGDYTWPQSDRYSPHRHDYNCFDSFMQSKGITGIGNMLSHSIDSNILFIKQHLRTYSTNYNYKHMLFSRLGFKTLEKRFRSYGWEEIHKYRNIVDIRKLENDLSSRYGTTKSVILWNNVFADLLGIEPGKNDAF